MKSQLVIDENIDEHQRLLNIQENYFANLLELGVLFQTRGSLKGPLKL